MTRASTSKQFPNQASTSESGKVKPSKKKTKLKKPKEKKTATQRAIDSLDEYYQTVRRPIKLADFMSELQIDKAEEGDEESLPIEVCRVVSVMPNVPIKEEYTEEVTSESCMMVLPMDYSSEEDLSFPKTDESDPDIVSRMGHVNLGGDSESTDGSLDATMADSEENVSLNEFNPEEVDQVQLRSGKILPPPPKKMISNKDKGKEIVINDDIIPEDPKKKNTSATGVD